MMQVSALGGLDAKDIERAVTKFARGPDGGLIASTSLSNNNRGLIISLAARHELPAVYRTVSLLTAAHLIRV